MTIINLKEFREQLGLTQEKMAYLCGVHVNTWGKWERRERQPPAIAEMYFRIIIWLNRTGLLSFWQKFIL